MRVILKAEGLMREYFGGDPREVELPGAATLGDLLSWIEGEYGERLSGSIWNWTEHRFRGPVVIMIDQRAAKDRAVPLRDQQEVSFCKALVGG